MVTLELVGVSARYGRRVIYAGATTPVIRGGQLTALVGANASGKSTLMRRIAGQLPGGGAVRLTGAGPADVRYMPQDTAMTAALSVLESVILSLRQGERGWRLDPGDLAQADAVLTSLGIASLADRTLGELSGGQRQLVSVAQTLVRQPKVVLLDEPTSALDLCRQLEVLDHLRAYARRMGAVMVLALHDLTQVLRACAAVVAVSAGRVVAAGPTATTLTPDLIGYLYGVSARIETCSRGEPVLIVDRIPETAEGGGGSPRQSGATAPV